MNDRYQRHNLIDWFDQDSLRRSRVVVVGAGAVGNEVLKNLTLLGVGHLHVIDFDKIEEHNLTRSVLFREQDIGYFKADVAAEACRRIDPNVDIKSSTRDLWDALSLSELKESDCVICCVDNFEARLNLNRLCLLTETDLYNTGIDSRHVTVELYPFSTSPDCACYECTLPPSAYNTVQERYSCGWLRKVSVAERKIPTTTITSSLAAAAVVSMMLNRMCRHPQAMTETSRFFQDAITLASTVSVMYRAEDCYGCGSVPANAWVARAKRTVAAEPVVPLVNVLSAQVVLSEPVVSHTVCSQCGNKTEFFESSKRLTDAITFCSICGEQSNEVFYIEQLDLSDLADIFAERPIPCKYLTVIGENLTPVILEMED